MRPPAGIPSTVPAIDARRPQASPPGVVSEMERAKRLELSTSILMVREN